MKMGDTIRMLREQRNLTQEELGALIGVKKAAIQKYESGKVENIKKKNIKILADFFGVSPSYILGYKDKDTPATEVVEVSEEDKQIAILWQKMSKDKKQKALEYLDFLNSKENQ